MILKLTYFWYVVSNREDDRYRQEILLDGEVLERMNYGKVSLQRHRHRHVHRPGPVLNVIKLFDR